MKKGRHRRYEEARKFQRENASQFSVEDFDFEDRDPWSSGDDEEDSDDDQYSDLADKYDEIPGLAEKYADLDPDAEPKPAPERKAEEAEEA